MSDNTKIYQFKVRLKDVNPMIWRRFLIESNKTLKDLHYIIQILMGWTDYHLNEFIIKGQIFFRARTHNKHRIENVKKSSGKANHSSL